MENYTVQSDPPQVNPELTLRSSYAMIGVLSVFYAAMFIAGLIGNFAVLLIVLRNRHMRSVTNIFICNLSAADLLVTIFVEPLTLLQNIFIGNALK
ncbi:unnamed protein product [Dibothriocephalus latus]|uniref:G-protein coupled receptors family 1 profile domain-containing protein n=1 Tax=Dibothriocephalus latus TaxID=60516 RepID=A0A3P7LSF5_DIBLA|nr:unnamed protein product [Dibothriocephalus latus]